MTKTKRGPFMKHRVDPTTPQVCRYTTS